MLIKITRESVKFIGSKVYSRELYKYGIVIYNSYHYDIINNSNNIIVIITTIIIIIASTTKCSNLIGS